MEQGQAALYTGDYQRARKKFKEIERKMKKLQQSMPHQMAAYETIISEFSFCKINFESKSKARVGMVTQDVYHVTMQRLEEIEKKIKKFPR